ncbi:glycosyltransferase [Salinibacter ruber]|uniref:glycosyltransferase n=1 Tax=Salinibacter ruber TaxID=146919 RepID=UPI002169ABD0|nr:glycosyltransferase [Salinibacter ruber]MCS3685486.1 glycosyltransferase involved in cell wall biosynthesis [Salinibacter ruber]
MIYLYSDILTQAGGIETYLHALATKLHKEDIPFRVAVSEQRPEEAPCASLDDLEEKGVDVYRQPYVPGDRWRVRKCLLMAWLWWQLEPGDWVYCVRQPIPDLYLNLVRLVHNRGAKIAASWTFAPEFLVPDPPYHTSFCQAVEETDAVISVSECTTHQFEEVYGYKGPVEVVRYHNLQLFDEPVPLPKGPPWRIGYMGRLSIEQKNLDTLLQAFTQLRRSGLQAEFHFYGDGSDEDALQEQARKLGIAEAVEFHGRYDHRTDLPDIIANNHVFTYTSNYEGGPCFTLLELLQAGRYVVASPVGGIPDIYEGHPEAGLLVEPDDPSAISDTLETSIERLRSDQIEPEAIRNRYLDEFDMAAAHADWKTTLFPEADSRVA